MEHIISFGDIFSEQRRPFYIEMAGITYPDPSYHIERTNSYIQCFEYVTKGEGIVTVDGQTVYPREGDLYILPKGSNHNYRSMPENPFEKIWFNISSSLCDELVHVYGITGVIIVKDTNAYPLFRILRHLREQGALARRDIHAMLCGAP